MSLARKLFDTALDQVLEFLEVPPPLVHAWAKQRWFDVSMAGASFVPHILLVRFTPRLQCNSPLSILSNSLLPIVTDLRPDSHHSSSERDRRLLVRWIIRQQASEYGSQVPH